MTEFNSFPKIQPIGRLFMTVTQKIHGSNAQIYIYADEHGEKQLKTGSRARWITPEDDNYGFARFVYDHKQEFIDKLGLGRHFGEWAGPGINSGEGLTEKKLLLFSQYWHDKELPPRTLTVPSLYHGMIDLKMIDIICNELKTNGSKLVPGYMRPEGIVIEIGNDRYKKVFNPEETSWKKPDGQKKEAQEKHKGINVSHLLQPIRLEKLLSRDERYRRDFPYSLSDICKDYVQDLSAEGQINGDEEEVKAIMKSLGAKVYSFVKEQIMLL